MDIVIIAVELDDGEYEVLGLIQRIENLVTRDGHDVRAGDSALNFEESKLALPRNAAFDVIAELPEFPILGFEAEHAIVIPDDRPVYCITCSCLT